jgi:hypothetical protein
VERWVAGGVINPVLPDAGAIDHDTNQVKRIIITANFDPFVMASAKFQPCAMIAQETRFCYLTALKGMYNGIRADPGFYQIVPY